MEQLLSALAASHYGDLASVAGVVISLIGFGVTVINVRKAEGASQQAERAARAAKESVMLFDTVVDFTLAINTLEEIKKLHRVGEWKLLPDRYATTRKFLINLRHSAIKLSDEQLAVVQNALTNLSSMESRVEQTLQTGTALKAAKFNDLISSDVDGLIATLAEIKNARAGA